MKIPFFLMWAHFRKTWFRSLLTLASVFVAVLIFGFLRTFIVGMEAQLASGENSRLVTGSAISLFAQLPKRLESEILQVEGVKAITHWTWFGGVYIDESPDHFWGRFGVDVPSFKEVYGPDIILSDEAWEKFLGTRTSCIIGAELAASEKLNLSDRVRIVGNNYPGTIDMEVVGIYESRVKSFDQKTLFFHWDYLNETTKAEGGRGDVVSTFTLLLKDSKKAADISQQIDATYESSDHRTRTLTERLFASQFNSMWGNVPLFFTVLGAVVLFSCLMVTANTMVLNARERVQEVGVLKTLGFSPKAITVMTLVEGIVICVAGGALAMAIVRLLDGKTLIFIPAFVPWRTVIEGVLIATALGIFSGIAPAILANRLKIVDALRRRA